MHAWPMERNVLGIPYGTKVLTIDRVRFPFLRPRSTSLGFLAMAEEHSDWFFRGGAGALVMPAVFDPRAVDAHARRVHDYVARGGPFVSRGGLLGHASGGWTVQDWQSDSALKPLADMLHGSAALHDALRRVFGAWKYRGPLSRADMTIDRRSDWHIDKVHGEFLPFMNVFRGRPSSANVDGDLHFKYLPDGKPYRIVTVAIYLQDHSNDSRSLTFRPGGHVGCTRGGDVAAEEHAGGRSVCMPQSARAGTLMHPPGMPTATLHPAKGDIVIFDTRLPHRGQDKSLPFRRLYAGQRHRILASLTYGAADNAFSDAYDRAFMWRNAFFNNESLRSSCGEIRCRKHAVLQAVKSEPPSELLTQLQLDPQLRIPAPALQTHSQAPPTSAGAMPGPSSPSAPQRVSPRRRAGQSAASIDRARAGHGGGNAWPSVTPSRRAVSVLIVGASRGLGLELVLDYLRRPPALQTRVHATVRKLADLSRLAMLGAIPHMLDVTDAAQRVSFANDLASDLASGGLDVLIHSAGVRGSNASLVRTTNLEAPFALLDLLVPLLRRGGGLDAHRTSRMYGSAAARAPRACIVTSDIRYGVKSNQSLRSHYARAKAAANSMVRTCAKRLFDMDGIFLAAIHPGSVRTDMNKKGLIEASKAATGVRMACERMRELPIGILTPDGKHLPWEAHR